MLLGAPVAGAQQRAGGVYGTVYDSLARKPLAGAVVDLAPLGGAGTTGSTTSDSAGYFEFANVSAGRYVVGFFHPRLDSLGIDAPERQVTVASGARVAADVAVPSARRIRAAICKTPAANGDSTGMLVGHVNDAVTGNSVDGAQVTAQWSLFSFVNGRLARSIPTVRAQTSANGWFAFCSLPTGATISVQVSHGADSSGVVGVDVQPAGVTVRTFYVARVTTVALAPTDAKSASDSLSSERVYRGPAQLVGVVRAEVNGAPVPGVQLTVQGTGLTVTSNDQGEFSLTQLPLGTQMLLARKVGHVPSEMAVDLVGTMPVHAVMLLPTLVSVMDTVKVLARKVYASDDNGFLRRQKAGMGHYFDADEVARLQPFETTDLLRRVPTVRVQESGLERRILMPSMRGGMCEPDIYIDGVKTPGLTASDLDVLVQPDAVGGMEVYAYPGDTPPELQTAFAQCGSVVVWTHTPQRRPKP